MERILDAGGDPSRFCVLFAASNPILERRDARAAEDNKIIRQRIALLITQIWVCLRSAALYAVPIYPGRNQDVRYIRESGIRRVLGLLVFAIAGFFIGVWAFRSLFSQFLSFILVLLPGPALLAALLATFLAAFQAAFQAATLAAIVTAISNSVRSKTTIICLESY
jgi:hypothetical protein